MRKDFNGPNREALTIPSTADFTKGDFYSSDSEALILPDAAQESKSDFTKSGKTGVYTKTWLLPQMSQEAEVERQYSRLRSNISGCTPQKAFLNPKSQGIARSIMEIREREFALEGMPSRTQRAFQEKRGRYVLHAQKPQTLNEYVLFYACHYYIRSEMTHLITNKITEKLFIRDTVGAKYVARVYAVFDDLSYLDSIWNQLPDKVVVKAVTGCYGGYVRIIDKNNPKMRSSIGSLKNAASSSITKQRFFVEEFLEPTTPGRTVTDYKFFCAYGTVLFVVVGDAPGGKSEIFPRDKFQAIYLVPDWVLLDVAYCNNPKGTLSRPSNLDEMIDIAQKISRDYPLIRVDFMNTRDERGQLRLIVGEITRRSACGSANFNPNSFELLAGVFVPRCSQSDLKVFLYRDILTFQAYGAWLQQHQDPLFDIVMPGFQRHCHVDMNFSLTRRSSAEIMSDSNQAWRLECDKKLLHSPHSVLRFHQQILGHEFQRNRPFLIREHGN
jgi:hypothetical protein